MRCCWPVLHGDIREMVQSATYRRVMVGNMEEEPTQTRAGRRMAERVEFLNLEDVMDDVKVRATNVVTFLHSGLSEVYSGTDRAQIESIRVLLNLKFFVRAVERSGSANIATIHFKKFLTFVFHPKFLATLSSLIILNFFPNPSSYQT